MLASPTLYNATIISCVFNGNIAGTNGGAIYIDSTRLYVISTTFSGNIAGSKGGAVYYFVDSDASYAASKLFIIGCAFSRNQAERAACIFSSNGYPIQRINSATNTFIDNTASVFGSKTLTKPKLFLATIDDVINPPMPTIYDHETGAFKVVALINFLGENDQLYKYEESGLTLMLSTSDTANSAISPSSITQNNGLFNLTSDIRLSGRTGKDFDLIISSP